MILASFSMSFMMVDGSAERMVQYQTSLENMNNEAVEFVRGISVVKTFGQSIFSLKRFHNTVENYRSQVLAYTLFARIPMVSFQTLLTSTPFVLVLSALLLFPKAENPQIFFLDALFYLFFTPIYGTMMMRLMYMSQNTQGVTDSLKRISDLMEVESLVYGENPKEPKNFNIKLENVSFSYPDSGKNALSNVNLELKTGETVAFVGGSGGGKSTLAMLIPRFWDVTEGKITIGGVDVKEIREETLMNHISFVFQNTNLYHKSIFENVREGKPNATEKEVLHALTLARCEEIIDKFPEGIHRKIGTEGMYLSGGIFRKCKQKNYTC